MKCYICDNTLRLEEIVLKNGLAEPCRSCIRISDENLKDISTDDVIDLPWVQEDE